MKHRIKKEPRYNKTVVYDPSTLELDDGIRMKLDTSDESMMIATIRSDKTGRAFSIYLIPDNLTGIMAGFDFGNLKENERKEFVKMIPGFIRKILSLLGIHDANSFNNQVINSHDEIIKFMNYKGI